MPEAKPMTQKKDQVETSLNTTAGNVPGVCTRVLSAFTKQKLPQGSEQPPRFPPVNLEPPLTVGDAVSTGRHRMRPAGILFRNAFYCASFTQHAITRAMGQQYARRCAGRFRTGRWSAVLRSAEVAAERQIGS